MVLVGERRMRAARLAGLATLDCVMVEEPIAADELLVIQLVENALREDLKPVEQARAYRRLMDAKSWSTRELAAELAIAQSSVVRALALLDLPAVVQEQVEQGALGPTVAYEVGARACRGPGGGRPGRGRAGAPPLRGRRTGPGGPAPPPPPSVRQARAGGPRLGRRRRAGPLEEGVIHFGGSRPSAGPSRSSRTESDPPGIRPPDPDDGRPPARRRSVCPPSPGGRAEPRGRSRAAPRTVRPPPPESLPLRPLRHGERR